MADRVLWIRVIDDEGDPGVVIGRVVLHDDDDTVIAEGSAADVGSSLLARAMRLGDTDRRGAFELLAGSGWSNGKLMLDTADQ